MEFVFDDGGRSDAGFKGLAGDCVTRSIAIATGKPYCEVYEAMAEGMKKFPGRQGGKRSARNGVSRCVYDPYLKSLGWSWTATMSIGSGCQTHLAQKELPGGRLIVRVSKHVTAVIDGVVHDTFDPSRNGARCVYGYWSKNQ